LAAGQRSGGERHAAQRPPAAQRSGDRALAGRQRRLLRGRARVTAMSLRSSRRLHPELRFLGLAGPGALFIVVSLLLPLLSIVVFSFWRTESYELHADWNLGNYATLLGEAAYRTFFLRSFVTAVIVTAICLICGWPIAYFIARYGGRYRLLLVLLLAAP